ncbi:hypothetical protein AB4Z48_01330 [Cupriavidus sp. 2TAF22]|uniref:hypothetical protein n=1 Tax=unclassified Cupriavidus TaxID=2640874 RepID=UPI003F92EBA5
MMRLFFFISLLILLAGGRPVVVPGQGDAVAVKSRGKKYGAVRARADADFSRADCGGFCAAAVMALPAS